LFPQGESAPIPYRGGRTLEEMKAFVEENLKGAAEEDDEHAGHTHDEL